MPALTITLGQAKKAIHSIVRQNKLNAVVSSLIVPVLVGVWAVFYEKITAVPDVGQFLFWGPLVIFFLLAVVSTYGIYDVQLAPEIYIETIASRERVNNLEEAVSFLTEIHEHSLVLSSVVRNYLASGAAEAEDLCKVLTSICELIAINRDALFGIERRELWSFSLYLANPDDGLLHPVWRSRHRDHPGQGPSRTWAPGCGHVGIAFAHRQAKICPDATAVGIWETVSGPGEKSYDRRVYVSFASQPIDPADEDGPYGVITATSDRVGRFDVGTSLALRFAADSIATIMRLKYTAEDRKVACRIITTKKMPSGQSLGGQT